MFDHYTVDALQVILFARYEASQAGRTELTENHLLLGLLHDAESPVNQLFKLTDSTQVIREGLEPVAKVPVSTSVDMPLSDFAKRVLDYVAEEARMQKSDSIGSEHILLGLLREKSLASSRLESVGLFLEKARSKIVAAGPLARPTSNIIFGKSPFDKL
jgi:ATP-dependent Clp protease ATP-binding subunit ClpC